LKNLARRALDQSNGAMFLNRKLIVQLSTSRFRPQPKETNISISQTPKQLMIMDAPTYQHHPNGGSTILKQQQSTPITSQYNYSDLNYDMMTSTNLHQQSSIPDNQNFFHPPSPSSQNMNNYYSNVPMDRMTPSSLKINHMKINKTIKTGNFNRMDLIK